MALSATIKEELQPHCRRSLSLISRMRSKCRPLFLSPKSLLLSKGGEWDAERKHFLLYVEVS